MERIAECQCGSLRAAVSGEPVRVNVCHCMACQRRTGSAFQYSALFAKDQVRVEGADKAWTRVADSGNTIRFHFCPECGSTVY
jgi:hypothetical protein